jgi:predicted SAM-dependent methyltransferase
MRITLQAVKRAVPQSLRSRIRAGLVEMVKQVYLIYQPLKRRRILKRVPLLLHLGCGSERLEDYVNIDVRLTGATDLVMDLNSFTFPEDTVHGIFSHAFFEHLRRQSRTDHLKAVWEALHPDTGFVCYLGLPYFRNIARFYLESAPGVVGPVFDLYNVYRYTHGDPEASGYYLEQLHKSLFDEQELSSLLLSAGFSSFLVSSYCFQGEKLPVNMGFYAIKHGMDQEGLRSEAIQFLKGFENSKIEPETITWIG